MAMYSTSISSIMSRIAISIALASVSPAMIRREARLRDREMLNALARSGSLR